MLKKVLLAVIAWYQRSISAALPRRCRYEPTCSRYAVEAIEIHGVIKGTILAVWRILRCNPWSKGGVDWVPPQGKWPTRPLNYSELLEVRRHAENEIL